MFALLAFRCLLFSFFFAVAASACCQCSFSVVLFSTMPMPMVDCLLLLLLFVYCCYGSQYDAVNVLIYLTLIDVIIIIEKQLFIASYCIYFPIILAHCTTTLRAQHDLFAAKMLSCRAARCAAIGYLNLSI